jgi:SAM-dependent methyltransferase
VTHGHDPRRHAPAAMRNQTPILEVLRRVLPAEGSVLEIGSGSGQHVTAFARELPGLVWRPSDVAGDNLVSIAAWGTETPQPNLRAPLRLDAAHPPWPGVEPASCDAVLCINVIHIAPWTVCQGLLAGAATALKRPGLLVLYGPYRRAGRHTAPSNETFDRMLKEQDPRFGVRDLDDVGAEAGCHGFRLVEVVAMPANNLTVIFRLGWSDLS